MEESARGALLTAKVTWAEAAVVDVLSALHSMAPIRSGLWCVLSSEGETVATYTRWARAAIDEADAATDLDTQNRRAVEAVGHAKRALDRLFDEFLRRDWLHLRTDARPTFSERLAVLRRRMGSRIPWRLIPPVVAEPRNTAEHDYASPSVDDAGRAVEAAEVIAAALHTPPLRPTLLGDISLMANFELQPEPHGVFYGFGEQHGTFALIVEDRDGVVRLGVGRVADNQTAEVLWCRLQALSLTQHLELLAWWDQQCTGRPRTDESGTQLMLDALGLNGPR